MANLLPCPAITKKIRRLAKRLKVHLSLGPLVAVAVVTIPLEQRPDVPSKLRLANRLAKEKRRQHPSRSVDRKHHKPPES